MRVRADVLTSAANARLQKAIKKIQKQGFVSANDLKNLGKETARILVPKGKNKWLYSTIQGKTYTRGTVDHAEIFLDPKFVPNNKEHRWGVGKYPNFDLARWGHTTSKGRNHFKNGHGNFMTKTKKILEGMGVKRVQGAYRKLKL